MHLGCDFIGLLIVLRKLVLKLVNEVSAVSLVLAPFFILFSCSSSFTLGQLSMKLSNGFPRLEIQSHCSCHSYFYKSSAEGPKSDSQVKKTFQA